MVCFNELTFKYHAALPLQFLTCVCLVGCLGGWLGGRYLIIVVLFVCLVGCLVGWVAGW
jgi:hypothetical protein